MTRTTLIRIKASALQTSYVVTWPAVEFAHMLHRILVVEDHEPFRRFICASLAGRTETQTFEVADGYAAIEQAGALQPDVILLDIGLPGMHGLDVARQLRRMAPASRVVFVTGESDPDVIHETLRLGASGYVHKSRCGDDLMPAIDFALAGRHFVSSTLDTRRHRRHDVLFCSDDAVLIEGFSNFAGTSIRTGQAAIVLATEPNRTGVIRTLRGRGIEIDAAIERGSCVLLDAAAMLDSIMVDGVPDRGRFLDSVRSWIGRVSKATASDTPRVALCGEGAGLLCASGDLGAALTFERTGSDLVHAHPVDILCAYPLPRWRDDDRLFARVCAHHSAVRYM
jgi:CheY-like chemotaxis protein